MTQSRISRRDCLARSCAVAGGVLSGSLSVAQAAGREPLSFAIFSDTHIGYRGRDSARIQWQKTADELAKLDVSFLLHLGDVVDGGQVELYPVSARFANGSLDRFTRFPATTIRRTGSQSTSARRCQSLIVAAALHPAEQCSPRFARRILYRAAARLAGETA